LSYFGDLDDPFPERPGNVTLSRDPGAKFPGLADCLDKLDARLRRYRWICFVDEDIWARCETWNTFFAVVEQLNPALAQPALKHRSFFTHDVTLARRQFVARWTNFVEIMNFCFRLDFLDDMRPTFRDSVSGWGLDFHWAAAARPEERALLVVD